MKGLPEDRAIELGRYIIRTGATVRDTAKIFGISKSTVHKDVSQRLERVSPTLFNECRAVLDQNKAERHIRGGLATKERFFHLKTST